MEPTAYHKTDPNQAPGPGPTQATTQPALIVLDQPNTQLSWQR